MDEVSEVPERKVLTEADLWRTNSPLIWRAEKFEGWPHFYPVFKWKDYYSFAPLPLARLKRNVKLNANCARFLTTVTEPYTPPDILIDEEIERIGRPRPFSCRMKEKHPYLRQLAAAIHSDVRLVEDKNPGLTNFVLCGGKDSLNGLLLNWKNPVVVLSAEPNYTLVRDFIRANGLRFDLVKLTDYVDETLIDREVAENFCRIDLQHTRWAAHLAKLAGEVNRKAIFWMGSMGEGYLSPRWMKYTGNRHPLNVHFRKGFRATVRRVDGLRKLGWNLGIKRDLESTFWVRGAAWQGTIIAHYRSITGCLTQSFYHGPETVSVLHESDISELVGEDIRAELGNHLAGTKVEFPKSNPAPGEIPARKGLWTVERFIQSLKPLGLPVRE